MQLSRESFTDPGESSAFQVVRQRAWVTYERSMRSIGTLGYIRRLVTCKARLEAGLRGRFKIDQHVVQLILALAPCVLRSRKKPNHICVYRTGLAGSIDCDRRNPGIPLFVRLAPIHASTLFSPTTMLASATDETNIYAGHPQLTPLEADVLWEYAKLSRTLKALVTKSREMTEHSDDALLAKLRAAEMKMGLVHTLVSVFTHLAPLGPCNLSPQKTIPLSLGSMLRALRRWFAIRHAN
ncbi:DASH complex subunit dad3 domain-containing protein [Rhizoctonia solani AG-1 IA]|uniref:DASH complex subunit DAD3 n=1 Tax=Thanatephorus cucumeris (strain AG1-IA) TaxID=983506 RepID=L8WZP4_THACA|nr:DASH complex subunit dad3 domain-containing protein [Rhizoctonia solani AG-1 IA]